jgi:hypothetical protein
MPRARGKAATSSPSRRSTRHWAARLNSQASGSDDPATSQEGRNSKCRGGGGRGSGRGRGGQRRGGHLGSSGQVAHAEDISEATPDTGGTDHPMDEPVTMDVRLDVGSASESEAEVSAQSVKPQPRRQTVPVPVLNNGKLFCDILPATMYSLICTAEDGSPMHMSQSSDRRQLREGNDPHPARTAGLARPSRAEYAQKAAEAEVARAAANTARKEEITRLRARLAEVVGMQQQQEDEDEDDIIQGVQALADKDGEYDEEVGGDQESDEEEPPHSASRHSSPRTFKSPVRPQPLRMSSDL